MSVRDHSYEEIREVVVSLLLGQEPGVEVPTHWLNLTTSVADTFIKREGGTPALYGERLTPVDVELTRDVFWDLFRQGFVILGMNDNNPTWPYFRISYFGKNTLSHRNPYRFTDTASYIGAVKREIPSLDAVTEMYLDESITAFYAGAHLAACVMLGVAAENRFLLLLGTVAGNVRHQTITEAVDKERFILGKIKKFRDQLQGNFAVLPPALKEDMEVQFDAIQSLIRISRNDTGHPSGKVISREQMYVLLQLFIPFGKKLDQLNDHFAIP